MKKKFMQKLQRDNTDTIFLDNNTCQGQYNTKSQTGEKQCHKHPVVRHSKHHVKSTRNSKCHHILVC